MGNLNKIRLIDTLYGQHSRWGVFDKNYVSPTICAPMGMGGGHIPMIIRRMSNAKELSDSRERVK